MRWGYHNFVGIHKDHKSNINKKDNRQKKEKKYKEIRRFPVLIDSDFWVQDGDGDMNLVMVIDSNRCSHADVVLVHVPEIGSK